MDLNIDFYFPDLSGKDPLGWLPWAMPMADAFCPSRRILLMHSSVHCCYEYDLNP